MSEIESLKLEIKKTESILAESQKYYKDNPDDYSAKLLLLSTENYLSDLIRKLDVLMLQQIKTKE